MKLKRFLTLVAILALAVSAAFATTPPQQSEGPSTSTESPEVCQFSLSKYTGTVNSGYTESFTVGLSCELKETVHATVIVVIGNDIIASEVVKIEAGKTKSASISIKVGSEYNGQKYKLGVQ